MLSILIPVYNYNVYKLVETLYKQATEINGLLFEIIVCDDCSTEIYTENDTINSLENCSLFRLDKNIGRTAVRNLLATKAKYEYLLFLDADVQPKSNNFISNYLSNCNDSIIFGGCDYIRNQKYNSSLRYKFGIKKEAVSITQRKANPYKYIFSGNFLIEKSTFLNLNIPDNNQYGMDLLFSNLLFKNRITIIHINNPIYHIGLEDNETFLNKSLSAISYRFSLKDTLDFELEKIYKLTKLFFLNKIILFIYTANKQRIKENLISKNPSLFLFDFYRLGYYISLYKN